MTFVNKHLCIRDESTELLYLDVKNLYGWALSQKLPCGEFSWIYEKEELNNLIRKLPNVDCECDEYGIVCEIDILIPNHLHKELDDMPIAPVMDKPPGSKVDKLLMTHNTKTHYVIHGRLLQLYMSLGCVVQKIHRAVKFRQDYIFQEYIDKNTEMRSKATSTFEKNYFKLKNNSIYGKSVEDPRKRINVRLCNNPRKFRTYTTKATFERSIIIDEELVIVLLGKEKLTLNKPVYIGQAVLDISKWLMYHYRYNVMKKYEREFEESSITLAAGDTDSFFLEVKNLSLKEKLLPAMIRDGILDTSNYPSDHLLYSEQYITKIGVFKDESAGRCTYKEWVFLRPKCYSLLTEEEPNSMRKAKGVQREVIKQQLNHQKYKHLLTDSSLRVVCKMARIASSNHQLYTIQQSKVALSAVDDKRHWFEDNTSVAYGHYIINQD